jgi:hypothetical protein
MKLIGEQKAHKQIKKVEDIDLAAECRLLHIEEWEDRVQSEKQIEEMNLLEDLHWRQRAGKNLILKGDANTHFSHQYANGRRRKFTISYLEADGEEFRGQQRIIQHVVSFYKELFGHSKVSSLKLGASFWPDEFKVLAEDNRELVKVFGQKRSKE